VWSLEFLYKLKHIYGSFFPDVICTNMMIVNDYCLFKNPVKC